MVELLWESALIKNSRPPLFHTPSTVLLNRLSIIFIRFKEKINLNLALTFGEKHRSTFYPIGSCMNCQLFGCFRKVNWTVLLALRLFSQLLIIGIGVTWNGPWISNFSSYTCLLHVQKLNGRRRRLRRRVSRMKFFLHLRSILLHCIVTHSYVYLVSITSSLFKKNTFRMRARSYVALLSSLDSYLQPFSHLSFSRLVQIT